ncbi:hypothetical protein [Flavihumibacter petaseus]|uniref:Uncharacterized protein n=1 Tax=Flavihumibacter petaseus NBRC 106054 TaxID=1220578 RepID=A0A0E9MYW3_9BACT|nr:hypothetical protein [Flavihumibacter petaseus]GAO42591.1 hypothetical protein FPE01S_01_16060 [Flavihumibacter petaseus NBRC 106054]
MFVEFRTRVIVGAMLCVFASCHKDIQFDPIPPEISPHLTAFIDQDSISFPTGMSASIVKEGSNYTLRIKGRQAKISIELEAISYMDNFWPGKKFTENNVAGIPPSSITLVMNTESDSIPFSSYYEPSPGYVDERMEIIITERTEEYIEGIFCGDLYEETFPYYHIKVVSNGTFKAQF